MLEELQLGSPLGSGLLLFSFRGWRRLTESCQSLGFFLTKQEKISLKQKQLLALKGRRFIF